MSTYGKAKINMWVIGYIITVLLKINNQKYCCSTMLFANENISTLSEIT